MSPKSPPTSAPASGPARFADRPGLASAQVLKGRGTAENPANRFERIHVGEIDHEALHDSDPYELGPECSGGSAAPLPPTLYLRDASRTILATNDSPDVGFDVSLNPYRGCEHGCVYCYARPTHEYLGFSAGLDFESRILVKQDAPELLRRAFAARRWRPRVVGMCGVTDPYQPVERRLRITGRCLEVFAEFRNPVALITKSALVARDIEPLTQLAAHSAVAVNISITTLDPELHRKMEPRASHPEQRLRAIASLAEAGVPTGVMVAPVIPGLTDHEIPAILEAAANAGARRAGMIVLRLPHAVKDLFAQWLEEHFPDRRSKVLNHVRSLRGGGLNDPRFGSRMRGEGVYADHLSTLFAIARRRAGLTAEHFVLSTESFRRIDASQLELF